MPGYNAIVEFDGHQSAATGQSRQEDQPKIPGNRRPCSLAQAIASS